MTTNRPEGRSIFAWLLLLVTLALAGVAAGIYVFHEPEPQTEPATIADQFGGPFTLVDRNGKPFTDGNLKGKPFAIFFGFTHCPDVCPTSLSRMAQLRKQLGADGERFNIVFVSLDPERDSPETVGNYVDLFETPIIGLTGNSAQIADAAKAYGVFYEKVRQGEGDDYTIDHTASIFLVDADGRFVTTIAHGEDQATALAKVRRILN